MDKDLAKLIDGDVETTDSILEEYSHDTSIFEVVPQAVVFPKTINDVKKVVKYAIDNKKSQPSLSITARSGGTDMSGGAINESIILAFDKYLNEIGEVNGYSIHTQPGAYFRDMEEKTLKNRKIMPSYPASKSICGVGGPVSNNSGGEKSLIYGKTEKYVKSLKVILSDGNEYKVKPLSLKQLQHKMDFDTFEGKLYRGIFDIVNENYDLLKEAKPKVTKNSTGYKLWDIYDKESETFDLCQLFIGAQGTLGIITDIEYKLVDAYEESGILVGYARNLDNMGEMIELLKKHNPTTIEAFDEHTLRFAIKFFLQFRDGIGWSGLFKLALRMIPDAFIIARGLPKLPKMIFMASFDSNDPVEIKHKIEDLKKEVDSKNWKVTTEMAENNEKAERFWLMRRKSFKLLRDNVKGKHTAPFIDDFVVPPEHLAEFWPEIKEIMERYELLYTIAGHLGDGNFHIIPLMDLADEKERAKIEPCLREVIDLVKKYGGVISGEHNDGLIRSPFLKDMYGKEVFKLFEETKSFMDPLNIFNPHKKTTSNWQWSKDHMRKSF